ncbi:MAG: ABC transporter ATP-binding protein [Rhodobacteraceae bacterium]|nr:ABC transporter ATP-binding protein [Paracoccaceae bacterium]
MFRYFENLVDPFAAHAPDDNPPQKAVAFLRNYARPFYRVFVVATIMAIVVAAVELWLIYYMGHIVDVMGSSTRQTFWQDYGAELMLVAVFILFGRPILQLFDVALLNNTIMANFAPMVRWRAHNHVLRQSVGWFEDDFAGRISNRMMQAPSSAGEVMFQLFDAIAFSLAYLIGAAVLLAAADAKLLLPLALWFGLFLLLLSWVVRKIGPASKAAADARSKVTGRVVDSYTNIHSVKMFAHHEAELNYAKEAMIETRDTAMKEMRLYTIMDGGLVTLNGVLIVGVVGWAITLWVQGTASIGAVAAATAQALRLNAMTGWIMWALTGLFRDLGVVAEGMETIAQPVTMLDAPGARALELTGDADAQIEFRNVSHHYGRESGGLHELSLSIAAGEKIGLVGASGAGKSTLVKLLLRFYDAEAGQILIDGQNIADVQQDSLRRVIGMVQQDSSLLHRSVRDNILYGRPDASEAEMIDAARRAEAHDFIQDLTDGEGRRGYDALVGERGVKLSGGQRQRIALARVMLKNAPILALDEATSALDSEVEAAIQDTLYRMMEGKTVVAIAHRLSTIARMDRIVVLENGTIIEQGKHKALLAQNGIYARFWARQTGGFLGFDEQSSEEGQ